MLEIFKNLADLIAFKLLSLSPSSAAGKALHFFIEDITKIFALLVIIVFIVGFFRAGLSSEKIRNLLGGKRSKLFSYPFAVILGAVSPFCSCSSVPIFIGFLEAGVPLGITMAFLIASPMINEVAVIVLASTIGLKFAVIYVLTGLTIGIIGGLLIEKLKLEKYVEDYLQNGQLQKENNTDFSSFKHRAAYAKNQVKEIVGRVWLYVIIGVGAGAMLHGYVPQEFFAAYTSGNNLLAVPLAVLVGIPVYANATGAIPIVEVLLSKGIPIGTALAFLMSVAAISLPEMIILRKVLKPKLIAIFIGILMVCFIGVGYLFNFLNII